MADVSRDQLKKEITAILKNADLGKTSAKKVRQQLEEKLDVDLTDKKKMVDDLVMDYLKDQKNKGGSDEDDEENGDEDEEDEESEEEKKKPKKRGPPAKKAKKAASESEEDDDDDKESGDEYSPKKKAKPAPKKGKGKKKGSDGDDDEDWGKKAKKPRGGGGGGSSKGYTKTLQLSKDLAKLVGQEQMARHEVVKKVWAIIKERNLYDPKNKQFAICDDELYKVIGEKRFRIFGMMKYLKDHFS